MSEVVEVKGGFRLRVTLPGERRARRIPPTYKKRDQAERALALWRADVEGVVDQCQHDMDRFGCAICSKVNTRVPGTDHRGSRSLAIPFHQQQEKPGPLIRNFSIDKRIVDEHVLTEAILAEQDEVAEA